VGGKGRLENKNKKGLLFNAHLPCSMFDPSYISNDLIASHHVIITSKLNFKNPTTKNVIFNLSGN